MLFLLNSDHGQAFSALLPMGQLRQLALAQENCSLMQFVVTDFFWILVLYATTYCCFSRADLK
ncbi:MAG: hypothetical protein Q4C56_08200 [Peptococcaceae bacterium]|nr:hypothetical protein [Peptococcaceae bacterium]